MLRGFKDFEESLIFTIYSQVYIRDRYKNNSSSAKSVED